MAQNKEVDKSGREIANIIGKEKNIKLSKALLKALKEGEIITKEIKEGKRIGYKNMKELIEALNDD